MLQVIESLQRVVVVTGSFGSGKSEFSLNLAISMAEEARKLGQVIALADLDIINPYFRTREACALLEEKGIKPIVPSPEVLYSDLPIYGPGIHNLLHQDDVRLILDVGGDEMGATALGSLSGEISNSEHSMVMVVNPYRPFTHDVAGIGRMARGIEARARLKIHALISNPNLGPNTTAEAVMKGHHIVRAAAAELRLPVVGLLVLRRFLKLWEDRLVTEAGSIPVVPIDIHLSPWWLQQKMK